MTEAKATTVPTAGEFVRGSTEVFRTERIAVVLGFVERSKIDVNAFFEVVRTKPDVEPYVPGALEVSWVHENGTMTTFASCAQAEAPNWRRSPFHLNSASMYAIAIGTYKDVLGVWYALKNTMHTVPPYVSDDDPPYVISTLAQEVGQ